MSVEVDLTQQIISINDTRTEIVVQAPGPAGAQGPTGPTGPAGTAGPAGSAATIAVGTVTQGTAFAVTNSGSSSAAVFDFTLVKGDKGDKGNTGDTGPTGATGSAATITVGTVTTGTAGSNATVVNVGTSGAAIFDFSIPRGDKGETGNTGATGATGPAGTGVPVGGTAGQVLAKIDSTDYNTQWVNQTGGGGSATVVVGTSPINASTVSGTATVSIDAASTTQSGAVQLEDSTSSTSTTKAATPNSVKSAYDLASTANTTAGTAIPKNTVTATGDLLYASGSATVTRLGIGTAAQLLQVSVGGIPEWVTPPAAVGTAATGGVYGVTTLTDATNSTSTTTAATPNSVKSAYDLAAGKVASVAGTGAIASTGGTAPVISVADATTSVRGAVQLEDSTSSTSTTTAAVPNSVKSAYDLAAGKVASVAGTGAISSTGGTAPVISVADGSTTVKGAVQLEDSTSSTSTTTAAVPNSVKSAYDLANTANTTAGTAIPKATVTAAGDLIYASGSATVTRLGIGTAAQVLSVSAGGVPEWTTPTAAPGTAATGGVYGVTTLTDATNSTSITTAATPNSVKSAYDLADGKVSAVTGTSPISVTTTTGTAAVSVGTASTSVYGVTTLTDSTSSTSTTTAATPNSVKSAYDLAGTAIPKNTVTTAGDILYASGSATVTRLGIGTANQVLSVSGTVPAWTTPSSGGGYWIDISASVAGTALGLTSAAYDVENAGDFDSTISISGTAETFSVGEHKRITATGDITSIHRDSGVTWTARTSTFSSTNNVLAVAYGRNLWIIGGRNASLATSADGITWTARTATGFTPSYAVNAAAVNDEIYFIAGEQSRVATSTDGVTWTSQNAGFGTDEVRAAAYGGGLWVCVGDGGKITTSPDTVTWTVRTSNFLNAGVIYNITYANGLFVATGQGGGMVTSSNGTTWTSRTSGFDTSFVGGVSYGGGTWVVVGGAGKTATSTTGTAWTHNTAVGTSAFYDVDWDGKTWCVVGVGAAIYTSTNGTSWTSRTSAGTVELRAVAYGKGLFVTGGGANATNTTLQSAPAGVLSATFSPITYSTKP